MAGPSHLRCELNSERPKAASIDGRILLVDSQGNATAPDANCFHTLAGSTVWPLDPIVAMAAFHDPSGVLSYLVLIPAIKFFGSGWAIPLAPETAHLIKDMSVSQIQKAYVLYIGAGAVAAGGITSLLRSLPVIWSGLKGGLADLRGFRFYVELFYSMGNP